MIRGYVGGFPRTALANIFGSKFGKVLRMGENGGKLICHDYCLRSTKMLPIEFADKK